jgi:hypothetical protein
LQQARRWNAELIQCLQQEKEAAGYHFTLHVGSATMIQKPHNHLPLIRNPGQKSWKEQPTTLLPVSHVCSRHRGWSPPQELPNPTAGPHTPEAPAPEVYNVKARVK